MSAATIMYMQSRHPYLRPPSPDDMLGLFVLIAIVTVLIIIPVLVSSH